MLALGQGETRVFFSDEDAADRRAGGAAVPAPTAEAPATTLPPGRARFWTLWIGLVIGGFLWQFVGMAAGLLRP